MEPINYEELGKAMLLAAYGSVANVFASASPPKGRALFRELFKAVIIAGFCGIIALFLAKYMKIDPYQQNILIGIAGYMGGRFLQAIEKQAMRRILPNVNDNTSDSSSGALS